jgi:anti-sigma regulatory factor (Ser/Thr protein kinase)
MHHQEDKDGVTSEKDASTQETVALTVPSHPRFLYVVRSAIYPLVIDAGFSKQETRKIILAVDEACSNIIKYAYEGDNTKSIDVTVTICDEDIRIALRDRGKRTDVSKIAPRDLSEIRPGGLGTHFMNTVFDSVSYDAGAEQGTILTLIKKRSQVTRNEVEK